MRQGGCAARHTLERRHDVFAGELEARRSAELEAHSVCGEQGEGDGHASFGERSAHHRDQDGHGRDLMRRATGGGAALLLAVIACRPPAPRFTLLFLGRSPAASLGGLSWAPDPEHSRLVASDHELHVPPRTSNPRLATPMAVAPLGPAELLVTERTGEGVVVDTSEGGRVVREWESPDVASLYAAGGGGGRVVATRSPYYVPQLSTPEPDTAPLIRLLDTMGRPTGGLATIRRPATPLLDYVVNAGAVAVGGDGAVYYAPLVRDEIQKYGPGGQLAWTTKRGLFPSEPDPEFLPAKGAELRLKAALVNVALALGPPPDGRLYALGSDDSAATRLRVDVLDPATGAILATRHLGARETAVAVGGSRVLAVVDPASPGARANRAAPSTPRALWPAPQPPHPAGGTVRLP